MQGLELSFDYYQAHQKSLEEKFPHCVEKIAVGLAGEGSECFGYDDDLSTDHDFEPGFCLWLSKTDYEEYGFALERWYASLPSKWAGFSRQKLAPVGGRRHGVMTIDDFYRRFLGSPTAPTEEEHWLSLPPAALASATNGKVFRDDTGDFSHIREILLQGYPEDVRLKKMAAHAVFLFQSGLYNYSRCIKRKEFGAAQFAVFEFVKHTVSLLYLTENRYEPFYKWAYRGIRDFPLFAPLEASLVALTEMGNDPMESLAKEESMAEIAAYLGKIWEKKGLIQEENQTMEEIAFSLQNKIRSSFLRNLHIMEGI